MAEAVSPPSDQAIQAALAALDRVADDWVQRDEVNAVDVGFKFTGDKRTDELAVRVHIRRKIDEQELAARGIEAFPEELTGGIPVDVLQATYATRDDTSALGHDMAADATPSERNKRVRPVQPGFSCGSSGLTNVGTIGAVVFDRESGEPMLLSNWHVLAGQLKPRPGAPILQPGRNDGGSRTDRVAHLERFAIDERMDAAVARVEPGVGVNPIVPGLGLIVGHQEPRLGMVIAKSGRTTGVTRGIVDGIGLRTRIGYGTRDQYFCDQIRIVPLAPWPAIPSEITAGGDSGSVWIDPKTNRAVGLHFAGETDPAITAENAIATPIGRVLDELDVHFWPGGATLGAWQRLSHAR